MQYRLKNILLQNTTSCLLLGAFLYPNYTGDSPYYNGTKDYFTFVFINKRNYVENRFKIEFPLYIQGKLINSFAVYHDLKYESSIIKDNIFKRLEHSVNIGIIFSINKLNVIDF